MVSIVHSSDRNFVSRETAASRTAEAERGREADDDFPDRMRVNLVAAIALIALTLFGIWLANTMVATEKAHGCYSSGQQTCSLI